MSGNQFRFTAIETFMLVYYMKWLLNISLVLCWHYTIYSKIELSFLAANINFIVFGLTLIFSRPYISRHCTNTVFYCHNTFILNLTFFFISNSMLTLLWISHVEPYILKSSYLSSFIIDGAALLFSCINYRKYWKLLNVRESI
jgi:hypothetical protein